MSALAFKYFYPYFERSLRSLLPEKKERLAVAFSGGPDSWALLRLTQHWAMIHDVQIVALMVDHGFRVESRELLQQAGRCIAPLPFEILTWRDPVICQARARTARYALLCEACHRLQIQVLLLGHHLDDALETLWMRKQRMSSQWGLSGMSAVREIWGIKCLRPLLFAQKADLLSCLSSDDAYIQDPANSHPRFKRTHARIAIQEYSERQKNLLVQEMVQINQWRALQESQWAADYPCAYHGLGYVVMHRQFLNTACSDALHAILWHGMKAVAFQKTPPVVKALAQFAMRLQSESKGFQTFGGCLWRVEKEKLYILKEPHRIMKSICGFKQGRFLKKTHGMTDVSQLSFECSPLSLMHGETCVQRLFCQENDAQETSAHIRKLALQTWPCLTSFHLIRPSSFYPDFCAFEPFFA